MENSKQTKGEANQEPGDEKREEIKATLQQSKNDPSVKEALKKETQPVTADDLSPLHNTKEIGTSGGDQRASATERNADVASGEPLPEKERK